MLRRLSAMSFTRQQTGWNTAQMRWCWMKISPMRLQSLSLASYQMAPAFQRVMLIIKLKNAQSLTGADFLPVNVIMTRAKVLSGI